MASGGQDGDDRTDSIKLFDLKSGAHIRTLEGHERAVVALSFSPDGTELASGSDDTTIRVWDVATGDMKRTLSHGDFVRDVRYSPDGRLMGSASWDMTARIWRVRLGYRNTYTNIENLKHNGTLACILLFLSPFLSLSLVPSKISKTSSLVLSAQTHPIL